MAAKSKAIFIYSNKVLLAPIYQNACMTCDYIRCCFLDCMFKKIDVLGKKIDVLGKNAEIAELLNLMSTLLVYFLVLI